jgi:hypothetical protein
MSQGSSNPRVVATYPKEAITAFGELRVANMTPVTGWTFAYAIMTDLVGTTLVASGTVTQDASRAKVSSGAAINSSAKVYTKRALRYSPGIGGLARFTAVFETAGTAGNTRTIGIQNGTDGFSFGYNGTTFGIRYRRSSVDTWYPQSTWNYNTCPWLVHGNGNIYEINYQWLGYGWIFFSMEDPATGRITLVHAIKYSNTSPNVSILNPNLPIELVSENDGTCSTNCVVYSPSAMGFTESGHVGVEPHGPLDIPRQAGGAINGASSGVLLVLENQTTINGVTNRINLQLESLQATSDGSKMVNLFLVRNPTLGGAAPVWQNVLLNQSPVRYSTTAGITYTGGTILYQTTLMKLDRLSQELEHMAQEVEPGETLLIAFTSTANADMDASIIWMEGI